MRIFTNVNKKYPHEKVCSLVIVNNMKDKLKCKDTIIAKYLYLLKILQHKLPISTYHLNVEESLNADNITGRPYL